MNDLNQKAPLDRLLDVNAVAAWVGTTPATVWRAHRLGQMPSGVKVLGRLRWRAEDIERYLSGGWSGDDTPVVVA